MKITEAQTIKNIRKLRELNNWTQEDMANKLHTSLNSYASLERGETELSLRKLIKISEIFEIELIDLLQIGKNGLVVLVNEVNDNGDNTYNNFTYYGNPNKEHEEIKELQLTIAHQHELLSQQRREIENLSKIIAIIDKNPNI